MDTKRMLDQILSAGQGLAEQGRDIARKAEDYAADKAGVGDDAESRDALRSGAVGGALAAGVLGLLLGTRGGRKLGGAALRVGTLAALGTVAYNAYKKYAGQDAPDEEAQSVGALEGDAAETRSRILLAAMVAAAKTDGHIDEREREIIETRMKGLGDAGPDVVETAIRTPTDPKVIASMAENEQARREIYAISFYAVNADAPEERRYLDDLAAELSLDAEVARAIEEGASKTA